MMGLRRYAADHDGSAGKVAEPAARDLDSLSAQSKAARIGIRVVADSERHLPQVGELVIGEYNAARRGDLHSGRLLAPMIARRFKSPTPPAAVADCITGIVGDLSGEKGAALLTRISAGARKLEPTRVLKAQAAEVKVGDRVVIVAGDDHQ